MERRIAPPGSAELQAVLDSLVSPSSGRSEGIFRSKQKVLMFAASLGWKLRKRIQLERRGEPIRWGIFEAAYDEGFVNSLAVSEKKSLMILSPEHEEERIRIFEEYAHGGMLELKRLTSLPGDNLEFILESVMDTRSEEPAPEGVVPDLARLFGA